MTPRKLAISLFFASVAINAILGIVALFAGDFGETQGQVLTTSLSVSAASVLSLAMFPARERGNLAQVPNAGIGLSIVGFTLLIILIWSDVRGDVLWRITVSILTLAVASGYASLMSLAVLRKQQRPVTSIAYGLDALLAFIVVAAIWSEPGGEVFPRVMGVISILLAAATVSIPVLHRLNLSTAQVESPPTQIADETAHVFLERPPTICLSCGEPWSAGTNQDEFVCPSCDARFQIKIRG